MIYDIVNAVVYVILAQLFCSAFLKREKQSQVVSFLLSILWVLVVLGAATVFETMPAVRIVLAVIINIVFALSIYKDNKPIKVASIAAMFYVLVIVCDTFVIAIHKYLDPGMRIEKIMESDISIYMGAVSQFIQIILVFVIRRLFRRVKTAEIQSKLWLIYTVFPLYSLSLIILLVYSFDGPIGSFQANAFTYIAISLLLINLFVYWFIRQESQRVLETQKNEMEKIHAQGILQLYDQITTERDILGRREHEFKNIITALKGLLKEEQYDKMKEILDVQNTELITNANVFETGNRLVNSILNTKYSEAREKGITFRFVINNLSSLNIDDRDCIVILSNILNNAIEAAEKCPRDNRYLDVKATIEDGQFIFACRNSYVTDFDIEMKSKKKDVISHGYGIENIKDAVNRNNGDCILKKEETEFVAVIILPL